MVEVPQIPERVVGFKLNPDSGQALLDAEALRTCLSQIVEYIKELQALTATRMQEEISDRVKVLQDDLKISIKEGCNEVEREMKAQMSSLDGKVQGNSNRIGDLEADLTKTKKTMKAQASAAAAAQKESEQQAKLKAAAAKEEGKEEAKKKEEKPAPVEQPKADVVQVAAGPPQGYDQALRDIDENKFNIQNLELKFENEVFAMQRKAERLEKKVDEEKEKLEELKASHGQLQETCGGQASEISALQEKIQALDDSKASRTEHGEAVEQFEQLQGALTKVDTTSHAIAVQLERCEDKVTKLETLRRDLKDATEKSDKNAEETKTRLDESLNTLSDFSTRLGTCEKEAHESKDVLTKRANDAEERIECNSRAVEGIKTKADLREVMLLKEAMSGLVQQAREKDTVLFGAKCLSCNRVFDDVDRSAGGVDTHAERERAQVLNEVQRALNHPAGDFSKPIKMLSVKVGRTGQVHAADGSGPYETREAGYGYPLEDVSLVVQSGPLQTGQSSRSSYGNDKAKNSRADGLKGIPSVKREGPHDYKRGLHELVGHTPVTSPTRAGTNRAASAGRAPDPQGIAQASYTNPELQPWIPESTSPTRDVTSPRSARLSSHPKQMQAAS